MTSEQRSDASNNPSPSLSTKLSWVMLNAVPGVGNQTICQLLRVFGLPEYVFDASEAQLTKVVSAQIARNIKTFDGEVVMNSTQAWLANELNQLITIADAHYPQQLLQISDPPTILYTKGDTELLNSQCLAIVGGRNATQEGERNAERFAQALSNEGFCIVSGMALGIDGAAHRGALSGSSNTIAVVGTGLDIVYPAKHRTLAHDIAANGLIISEFPLGTPSRPGNFPKCNRIISGLSDGCLVIEANIKSGSLITAKIAAEQGREVFAIPGSIHSPMAKGCHQLIKEGAKLVECTQDILDELPVKAHTKPSHFSASIEYPKIEDTNKNDQHPLLHHIDFGPTSLEHIMQNSGLSPQEVTAALMLLTLDNMIEELPGKYYQRIG